LSRPLRHLRWVHSVGIGLSDSAPEFIFLENIVSVDLLVLRRDAGWYD
jgi:hypothetical protein